MCETYEDDDIIELCSREEILISMKPRITIRLLISINSVSIFQKHHYVPFLDAYQKALGENEYYEQVLRVITMLDDPVIKAKRLDGQKWYEIDDIQDLDIAESIFSA